MSTKGALHFQTLMAALLVSLLMAGCGGGGSGDPNPNPNPVNNPGGAQGNLNNGGNLPVDPADVPVPHAITAAWPDAPLGTNPAYNVRPAGGDVVSRTASKAGSTLEDGAFYEINGVAVTLKNGTPDFEASGQSFQEGDEITLWVEYETVAGATFSRYWNIPSLDLYYTEPSVTATQGGVYLVGFDMNLGIGSATEEAIFTFVLAEPKETSLVAVPATESASIGFAVTALPVEPPVLYPINGEAQMMWEDLIVNSDYDYNDMVARMTAAEWRDLDGNLVQIDLWVKAIARGAGYDADWQFNMDAAFPGASVVAIIDQYYANGTPHGEQRVWKSEDGASVPIFAPTRDALPTPPDHSFATNVVPNTTFIDGDYATVKIILDTPMAPGTYTPMPYEPELKVTASGGNVYTIGLWREPGDDVDVNGRPLGFIIPDSFPWMLESKKIWLSYLGFNAWVTWVNNPVGQQPSPYWWDLAPTGTNHYQRSRFLPWPAP